jgi:hypothetical protein
LLFAQASLDSDPLINTGSWDDSSHHGARLLVEMGSCKLFSCLVSNHNPPDLCLLGKFGSFFDKNLIVFTFLSLTPNFFFYINQQKGEGS